MSTFSLRLPDDDCEAPASSGSRYWSAYGVGRPRRSADCTFLTPGERAWEVSPVRAVRLGLPSHSSQLHHGGRSPYLKVVHPRFAAGAPLDLRLVADNQAGADEGPLRDGR